MIAGKALDVQRTFEKLRTHNANIEEILLLSYAGLPMVSTLNSDQYENGLSAMAAGINDIVCRFAGEQTRGTDYHSMIILGTRGYLLIREIKGVGILVVTTSTEIDWISLQGHVDWMVSTIAGFKEDVTVVTDETDETDEAGEAGEMDEADETGETGEPDETGESDETDVRQA